jgi:hypothetical protein
LRFSGLGSLFEANGCVIHSEMRRHTTKGLHEVRLSADATEAVTKLADRTNGARISSEKPTSPDSLICQRRLSVESLSE